MFECGMCGKSEKRWFVRSYKYDNGEQFNEMVCAACANLHSQLTKEGK